MDIFAFWVVMAIITGTVFLLYPVTPEDESAGELAERIVPVLEQLSNRLTALEQGQGQLREQQQFLETLLEENEPPALGSGGSEE
jgi:nitrogen fixation/metabolism regulation signal transduction histidine kinase